MQNRVAYISVQPGRAGVAADESNPMVRDYYSATVIHYFSKKQSKTFGPIFIKCVKKYVKLFVPPF